MNKARIPNEFAFKMDLAGKVYGSAFVMRMKTEVAMLSQVKSRFGGWCDMGQQLCRMMRWVQALRWHLVQPHPWPPGLL